MKRLQKLYEQEEALLSTGRFGTGLWPIDPTLGAFLRQLIVQYDLQYGLEVGAGVGYSTSWFVDGFRQNGGRLISLEYFMPKVEQLEQHLQMLFGGAYEETVDVIPSSVTTWFQHVGAKKFDFVFFDQRKKDYLEHLRMLLPKLKKGAFVCTDNVISHPQECAEYLQYLRRSSSFETSTLELGAGLEISRFIG